MCFSRSLLILFGGLFMVLMPGISVGQSQTGKVEELVNQVYAERAERVELAGVEFRGRKVGPTKFRKCNGQVIDIGTKVPKLSGPCPGESGPRRIFVFEVEILGIDRIASVLSVRGKDGKKYEFYFPEDGKEIVTTSVSQDSVMGSVDGGTQAVFATSRSRKTTMRDVKLGELKSGSKITIVSMLEGRAEAIIR